MLKQASFVFTALSLCAANQAFALEVGDVAPCVELDQRLPSGAEVHGCIREPQEGRKFTILEFFSVTCSACEANLPPLTALARSVAAHATTRMVSIDRSRSAVFDYLTSRRGTIQFPVALDSGRDAKQAYGVVATPSLFVINENHTIVYKHTGVLNGLSQAEIQKIVRE